MPLSRLLSFLPEEGTHDALLKKCVNALKQASFISTMRGIKMKKNIISVNALKQASFISTILEPEEAKEYFRVSMPLSRLLSFLQKV